MLCFTALAAAGLAVRSPSSLDVQRGYSELLGEPPAAAVGEASLPQRNTSSATAVGFFLRTLAHPLHGTVEAAAGGSAPAWLAGVRHYRLLPGAFPKGMKFHFDGLSTVASFQFVANDDGAAAAPPVLSVVSRRLATDASNDYKKCIFFGTGTGPTLGTEVCFQNPGVNLLPIQGQLWLTIDTLSWGRVDPVTLETIDAKVDVPSFILNAHPACERFDSKQRRCFVQHPCGNISKTSGSPSPITDGVCFSKLNPSHVSAAADMTTEEIGRTKMAKSKILQHSHAPCLTEHFLVSKLDSFTPRINKLLTDSGLLRVLHQGEDSQWAVLDRRTNVTRVINGNFSFVNNHFWNCYEVVDSSTGRIDVVVDTVAATKDYLDIYFEHSLDVPLPSWPTLFHPPQRCIVPGDVVPGSSSGEEEKKKKEEEVAAVAAETVSCVPLLPVANVALTYFDYPTYNPAMKTNASYRWTYAIAPTDPATSRWFDSVVKIDMHSRTLAKSWTAEGIYFTEADFVARPGATAEDDGALLTIIYNATTDLSAFAVFDAATLTLLAQYPLGIAVPFHAHGIVCPNAGNDTKGCYTNP